MRKPVVVVTGASSGVGRAVARAYAARRARVALLARNVEALEACRAEVQAAGGEALVCPADVADSAAVFAAADEVVARWGGLDVWINVAMATVFAPVSAITPEEYGRVTKVSYLGYVHGTLAALRYMQPRNAGTIVQVGSALAFRSIPLQSAYCASKAAIRGFTDSLRCELIHEKSGIRVTQVHLPAVNTPQSDRQRNKMPKRQQPVPPIFDPAVIADAILWAADRAPRELLVGASTVQAILGQRLLPGALDAYLAHAGWEPQFVDEPNDQRDDILFHTLPGDPGAHGPYRDRERGADLQMRLRMNPIAAGLLGLLGAAVTAAITRGSAAREPGAGLSRSAAGQRESPAARP